MNTIPNTIPFIHVSEFFWYYPSNNYNNYTFVPKKYDDVLSATRSIISKSIAERYAMQQIWDNRKKLGLTINHKFQIQGNFNNELSNGLTNELRKKINKKKATRQGGFERFILFDCDQVFVDLTDDAEWQGQAEHL